MVAINHVGWEVQNLSECGWNNCCFDRDDAGNDTPTIFSTRKKAEQYLNSLGSIVYESEYRVYESLS
jgi:DUF1365 family protein